MLNMDKLIILKENLIFYTEVTFQNLAIILVPSAKFLEKLNHPHLYIIVSFKLTIYLLDIFFQVHLHYLANNNVCRPEMSPTGRAGTHPRSSAPGRGGKRTATRPQRSAAGARVLHP